MSDTAPIGCPFCGRTPKVSCPAGPNNWVVTCRFAGDGPGFDCPATAYALGETREEAVTQWNTRQQFQSKHTPEAKAKLSARYRRSMGFEK